MVNVNTPSEYYMTVFRPASLPNTQHPISPDLLRAHHPSESARLLPLPTRTLEHGPSTIEPESFPGPEHPFCQRNSRLDIDATLLHAFEHIPPDTIAASDTKQCPLHTTRCLARPDSSRARVERRLRGRRIRSKIAVSEIWTGCASYVCASRSRPKGRTCKHSISRLRASRPVGPSSVPPGNSRTGHVVDFRRKRGGEMEDFGFDCSNCAHGCRFRPSSDI